MSWANQGVQLLRLWPSLVLHSEHLFFSGVLSCYCCCWSAIKSSPELMENWRLLSLLPHHRQSFCCCICPVKQSLVLLPGQGQACAAGNRTYGRSHGKSFGELLKELGSGLVSSRMREGNASSLFVVWQPENFLLLSLETRVLFYIYVIPGMFLLRMPVPQPGTVSAPEHLAPGKRSRRAGGEECCRHRKHL